MATSNEAYQVNCMDEWGVFYRYWKDKPGCIAKVVEDLRAKGEIIPTPQEEMIPSIAIEPERVVRNV